MDIYDITRPIHQRMVTFPGHPGVVIERAKTLEDDEENVSQVAFGLTLGTHVDSPLHFDDNGASVGTYELSNFFGACTVLDFSSKEQSITLEDIQSKGELIKENDIVLLKTKNSSMFHDEFQQNYVFLEAEAATYITEKEIKAIGIDGPSFDTFQSPPVVEKMMFEQNIIVYKNLLLTQPQEERFMFYGFPLKIEHVEAAPVRAVLLSG